MTSLPLLYLNLLQVESGQAASTALPHDYMMACRFLRCGILDRSGTLDHGFRYRTLDHIPAPEAIDATFAELCADRARALVRIALESGKELRVLWSGGIDSTTALIAVSDAARKCGMEERVVVVLSLDSVHENPRFFLRHIMHNHRILRASHPIADSIDPSVINVTGEHGDQLFGSHLLSSYVRRGLAEVAWQDILPLILFERLGSVRAAIRVRRYLQPAIDAAPIPITSLFDYLWWLNFALKWQDVTLRISAWRGSEARASHQSIHHFFRTNEFQQWSLAQSVKLRPRVWAHYKEPAKRYILEHTGDHAYYATKEKEDSLRNVMGPRDTRIRYLVSMSDDFQPVYSRVEI